MSAILIINSIAKHNPQNDVINCSAIKFNREKYEQIENMIHIIQKDYGRRLELSNLISFNDLIDGAEYIEITDTTLLKGVSDAIKQVNEMRQEEGASIGVDIKNRINFILKSLRKLEKLSGKYIQERNSKYIDKIKSLLDDIKVDGDRLAQEIAINVDRFDFTEEIVRSISHCDQFNTLLKIDEPIGKKLNFILQELSREINTIGSKSPSTDVSQVVVELKSEIEKIREQIQNIL